MQAHKLSAQTIARIDEICDRFETAQQEHQTPRIEEYLNEIEQMAQAALFEELLKVELHYRRRNGDHPQPPEYISRFGRWADVVYRVFGSHPLEVGESISQTQTVSDLAREYDELWDMATGTMPDVFDFLQSHPDATPADQASVAQIDQFHRWKRDSRVQTILTVEQYAERLPDIAEDAQLMQELVRAEWEYLLQDQVAKQRQNFVDRFPRLSDAVLEFPLLQPKATTVSKTTSPQADSSRFRPLHLIGQGGLGEVYLAEDRELERQVALKNVRPPHNKDPESLRRFLFEAKVTGNLEHPAIVPVYGLSAGEPFYVMRLIRGESLQEAIRKLHAGEEGYTLRNLLLRFTTVCQAVAYAHSRGVIHRDLKPANVMLGPFGETFVVDWGLSKSLADGAEAVKAQPLTFDSADEHTRGIVGTPAYMSPEQADPNGSVSPASDVFGLGAILYHLLTGQPPFSGGSGWKDLLDQIQQANFTPPRKLAPDIPNSLEAICLCALAREPSERYESALALADDIERHLADEPVKVYDEPFMARFTRVLYHHSRVAMMMASALFGGLMLFAIFFAFLLPRSFRGDLHSFQSQLEQLNRAEKPSAPIETVAELSRRVFVVGSTNPKATPDEIEEAYDLAITLQKDLVNRFPEAPQVRINLARAYDQYARFQSGRIASSDEEHLPGRDRAAIGAYQQAIDSWLHILRSDPENLFHRDRTAAAHANFTWYVATFPLPIDDKVRQSREAELAVEYAQFANELTGGERASYLDTLAAIYAQTGQWESAIRTAKQAVEKTASEEHRKSFELRLNLYIDHKPFQEELEEFPSKQHL